MCEVCEVREILRARLDDGHLESAQLEALRENRSHREDDTSACVAELELAEVRAFEGDDVNGRCTEIICEKKKTICAEIVFGMKLSIKRAICDSISGIHFAMAREHV